MPAPVQAEFSASMLLDVVIKRAAGNSVAIMDTPIVLRESNHPPAYVNMQIIFCPTVLSFVTKIALCTNNLSGGSGTRTNNQSIKRQRKGSILSKVHRYRA